METVNRRAQLPALVVILSRLGPLRCSGKSYLKVLSQCFDLNKSDRLGQHHKLQPTPDPGHPGHCAHMHSAYTASCWMMGAHRTWLGVVQERWVHFPFWTYATNLNLKTHTINWRENSIDLSERCCFMKWLVNAHSLSAVIACGHILL